MLAIDGSWGLGNVRKEAGAIERKWELDEEPESFDLAVRTIVIVRG